MEEGEASGTPGVGFDDCPHTLGRPGTDVLMHRASSFPEGWAPGGLCPDGLLVLWPGVSVRPWGPQVGIPSWGVGSFLGLVFRGGVFGRTLRANVS